jgi:hypothetical protein
MALYLSTMISGFNAKEANLYAARIRDDGDVVGILKHGDGSYSVCRLKNKPVQHGQAPWSAPITSTVSQ